jgi:hypothetical protein
MDIGLVDSIAGIPSAQFDLLDQTSGVVACHARVQQRELDGRWRVSYVRGTDGGCLRAAVPLYACRSVNWPDPAYDPRTWDLPDEVRKDCVPGRCLLVEGYENRRSGLHVGHSASDPRLLRRVLATAARAAGAQNRCLVFPYVSRAAMTALADASDGRIAWTMFGREGHLRDVSDPGWESRLGSRVRYNLRRDKSLIAAAGVTTTAFPWPAIEDKACELIASHNRRKGHPDHPEFVRMRTHQWASCDSVELVAFIATSRAVTGALTALVWNDELYLYEIGLDGEHGLERRAVYLELVFRQPISFAQSRQLRIIRLGQMAEMVKAGRGAVLEEVYGGVLSFAHTTRFADDQTSQAGEAK